MNKQATRQETISANWIHSHVSSKESQDQQRVYRDSFEFECPHWRPSIQPISNDRSLVHGAHNPRSHQLGNGTTTAFVIQDHTSRGHFAGLNRTTSKSGCSSPSKVLRAKSHICRAGTATSDEIPTPFSDWKTDDASRTSNLQTYWTNAAFTKHRTRQSSRHHELPMKAS